MPGTKSLTRALGTWRRKFAAVTRHPIRHWHEFARHPVVERLLILIKSCMVTGVFFYPVWWIHVHYTSARIPHIPLSLAVSFLGVEFAAILGQLAASSAVKKYEALMEARSARLRPKVRNLIAGHFRGEDRVKVLRRLRRRAGHDVEVCMAEALAGVAGTARDGMSKLAVDIGLVRRWRRRAMRGHNELKDCLENLSLLSPAFGRPVLADLIESVPESMRAAAELALIRLSTAVETGARFDDLTSRSLLVRAMVAGEFHGEEARVAMDALPSILRAGDPARTDAALAFLAGWRRAVPLPWLEELSRHAEPRVRARAVELAPLASETDEASKLITTALSDADSSVRAAAIEAVGRLRLKQAIPALVAISNGLDDRLARLACSALAKLDAAGQAVLRRHLLSAQPRLAAFAAASLGEAGVAVETR